ncbi:DedA family protein, partial [Sulfolobus sp. B5]
PAGIAKMRLTYFILFTLSGHLVWDTVLAFIGYYFGSSWQPIVSELTRFDYIILSIVLIALVIYILIKYNFLKFK